MRIGCLQFAPQVGDVEANLNRADAVLEAHEDLELDLLVLPELAFSGYNFRSLRHISPFLEPTTAGVSSSWARSTALKHDCNVIVGYPETADVSHKWPSDPEYFNSAVVVNSDGDTWGHYRKSHLYYTDETWALEGPGFFKGHIPGLGMLAMGICMDLNPYKFEAPWTDYEFAIHARNIGANVVVLSMAWLTREPAEAFCAQPAEPDMETLTYWIKRLEPLIRNDTDQEIIVIFANRCGVEDEAVYAGSSAVIGIQRGEVTVYGLLGRAEEKLLVVDTEGPGFAKLVYRPEGRERDESSDMSGDEVDDNDSQPDEKKHLPGTDEQGSGPTDGGFEGGHLIGHRTHGHVFLGVDPSSPMSTAFEMSAMGDSPLSPRYFWDQSSRIGAPVPTQFPKRDMRKTYQDWRTSVISQSTMFSIDGTQYGSLISDAVTDPQVEFSRLMTQLRGGPEAKPTLRRTVAAEGRDQGAPRHAVKDDQRQLQRDLAGLRRIPDSSQVATKSTISVDKSQRETPRRKPSRELNVRESVVDQKPPVESRLRASSDDISPEVDRLGMDLVSMRLAEAQKKRDSLLCHVDEDDFIILQTQRRDSPTLNDVVLGDRLPRNDSGSATNSRKQVVARVEDSGRVPSRTPQQRERESGSSSRHDTPSREVGRAPAARKEAPLSPPSKAIAQFASREVAHRHSNSDMRLSNTGKSSRHRPKDELLDAHVSKPSDIRGERHHNDGRHSANHEIRRDTPQHVRSKQTSITSREQNDTPSRTRMREKIGAGTPLSISITSSSTSSRENSSPRGGSGGQRRDKKTSSTPRTGEMPPTPKAMVLPPMYAYEISEKLEKVQQRDPSLKHEAVAAAAEPRKALGGFSNELMPAGVDKIARPRSAVW